MGILLVIRHRILFFFLTLHASHLLRCLIVNRKFAVHPIERNHYITLAISFFNDKAYKLYCKDYYLK